MIAEFSLALLAYLVVGVLIGAFLSLLLRIGEHYDDDGEMLVLFSILFWPVALIISFLVLFATVLTRLSIQIAKLIRSRWNG